MKFKCQILDPDVVVFDLRGNLDSECHLLVLFFKFFLVCWCGVSGLPYFSCILIDFFVKYLYDSVHIREEEGAVIPSFAKVYVF